MWESCSSAGTPGNPGAAGIQCLVPLFKNVVTGLVALSAVALFIMLVVGGFNFMFAAGDQKKIEQARGTITAAVIGIVVIAVAYLIIKLIQVFTGVDLTTFQLNI